MRPKPRFQVGHAQISIRSSTELRERKEQTKRNRRWQKKLFPQFPFSDGEDRSLEGGGGRPVNVIISFLLRNGKGAPRGPLIPLSPLPQVFKVAGLIYRAKLHGSVEITNRSRGDYRARNFRLRKEREPTQRKAVGFHPDQLSVT